LKGPTLAVRALTDLIRAERGVRFGSVNVVAVEPNGDHHTEGAHHHASKSHLSPLHG
jgi:CopG family transcriptional regulator, nickel-responsive regulator